MRLRRNYTDKKTLSCLSVSCIRARLNACLAEKREPGNTSRGFSWMLFGSMLFCMVAFSGSVHAQGFGKIVGNVIDPSGAVIPNAKVTATEAGKGFSRTATTDSSGYYVLDSLRPAQYNLTVEATGFHTFDQKGVTLLADQTLTANVNMQVGAVSESVSVSTAGELVDTTTSTLKQVIEERSITELPLNGRNAAELSLLVAGTVSYPTNPSNPTGTFAGGALQGATKTFPGAVAIVTNGSRQNQVSYQLAAALAFVQMDRPVDNYGQAVGRHHRRVEGAAAEEHAAQLGGLFLERKVVVAGGRAADVDHLAAQPDVLQHRVRFQDASDALRELADRKDVRRVLKRRKPQQRFRHRPPA